VALPIFAAQRVLAADLRGSSWPVVIETSAAPRFTKLRGAGQGVLPLIAEIIVASLAEAIGLRVPTRCLVTLEANIESLNQRDELRDLLDASVGLNLGFSYLDDARMFTPADVSRVSEDDAAAIVWLDAFVMNPDRTERNPNLMWLRDQLWLIDHGAALSFQYAWSDVTETAPSRVFAPGDPHVLQSRVANIAEWDDLFAARLTREAIEAAVEDVPEDFLIAAGVANDADALRRRRAAYVAYLWKRLKLPRAFFQSMATMSTPRQRARPEWLRRPER
jgi:predicted DNA-binding protein